MKSLTRNRAAGILSGALTLLHAAVAQAATTTTGSEATPLHLTGTTPAGHVSGGGGSGIVRTIVGLFVVIAVIYGVSWILRQTKRGGSTRTRGKALRSVASLPLGSGRSVQLVRAGRELVLLGVAEHGVTTIRRYSEAEAIEAGLDLSADEGPDSPEEESSGGRMLEVLRRITVR